jgi:hypothetical protein
VRSSAEPAARAAEAKYRLAAAHLGRLPLDDAGPTRRGGTPEPHADVPPAPNAIPLAKRSGLADNDT